jgi:hypothetical protein
VADMYDLSGGAMWGNKVDQIISYYRPRFHEDKNSKEVEIYIQKVKRKRTGGQLGYFSIYLDWKTKRYCHPITAESYCNPLAAKKAKVPKGEEQDMFKPFIDNSEIGF